ncbi:histidine triad nucleotide-binding protein [Helicobacter winghamensis]|uniref:Histidine triad nucleotide-binding protein n=1 Tax=Helicobacter winghamensis TaxID=157268 RepID=A0A2N3PI04_9HELI|nr:histidine triad nucleotide-binding protein [Helicobacter winghamensis]EEO26153.1 histidine triad domain protein [Helicobacter winghamensis ATCC BAA-430]PKT75708.1 histidine triad nucleotide-binding protein [Helicobacter winghamensis]PKT80300.1 histidine triad nucleotide-binding protein [Helicobacter winghamensis]PKT80665.1 histidine triad nucleotide-binding protein [Helicobacter winghamensis]QOQ97420.1 histidine triad nucleotide-binding protein [Helicobacter winghamensis]
MSVFEKIIKGEIPCNKVLENDDFLAFHDIAPKAPIHVLAIPKKFAKDFQELEPQEMAGLTSFIQEVAKLLGLDKSGYRIISNVGVDGGQEIPYLHFHILGGAKLRWDNLAQNISEKQRLEEAKKGM